MEEGDLFCMMFFVLCKFMCVIFKNVIQKKCEVVVGVFEVEKYIV